MSISRSYNKQNDMTYVYEVYDNHWNKEKKRPESKRRLIGKIDPETGEIVPTSRINKKAAKDDNEIQGCGTLYEEAKEKIAQQEKEIAELKNQLSSVLSDEVSYLSGLEHEILKKIQAAQELLRKLKQYD